YQVKISYKNIGKLPTAFRQADLVKIVRPDHVKILFSKDASKSYKLLSEDFKATRRSYGRETVAEVPSEYFSNTGYTQGGEENISILKIRVYGNNPVEMTVSVGTTRAGLLPEKKVVIK
ncbi:MAG: hypothetical protein RR555_09390, partial [Bacteroidales bacterium]